MATYLVTLKGPPGDAAKASPDQKAVDDVLLDYYKAVMPFEDAKAQMAKMNPQQKQVELGQRAISRYGCFSCHDIKGFEKAQSIGTDLSGRGQQAGHAPRFRVHHRHPAHVEDRRGSGRKLHDPRIFDKGRVLQPRTKLRMPNFDFSDEEVERLLTALMSFQREIQPPAAMPAQSARYDNLGVGRTLVHRRNCVGCHIIEGDGGDFLKLVADPSLGPPRLTPEGARVQPDWLYAFLRGPITIRPWLSVRMPTFGLDDQNLNGVIRYFGSISNSIGPFQTHEVMRGRRTKGRAKQLFELLKCQQCHVLGAIPGSADVEPGAGSPHGVGTAAARLDHGVAEEAVGHPAGHAHAGVLAGLSEVVLPADGRRRRGADPRDSRPPADVQGRAQPQEGRRRVAAN